jgi:fumarate reductase flavoprotein subunit
MTAQDYGRSDVVVVGSGFGGLTAAVRAQELGARVTIFEKSADRPGLSNSRMSGARFHIYGSPPTASPSDLADRLLAAGKGSLSEPLVRAWTAACGRAYRWTQQHGFRYVTLRGSPVMAPVRPNRRGAVWVRRGADVNVERLLNEFVRRGGSYVSGTEVTAVDRDARGGRTRHSGSGREGRFQSNAVVLADGGFQSNLDMLRAYARVPAPERLIQRGAGSGSGTALRVALELGGALVSGDALYAHLIHRDAVEIPEICHYPMLDTLAAESLLLGRDGRRFCDERRGGLHVANRIARLPDPASTWLILDRHRWETAARLNQIVPPNPNLVLANARIATASDVMGIAQAIGAPPEAVRQTLDASPLELRPPLLAIPVAVGLTFTMGGPLIDGHARVLGDRGPIEGLYAVGGAAGGLQGGPDPTYAAGIAAAITLGLLAGEHAAALPR